MDDHLKELGAQRILTMGKGDEQSGQDESFKEWAKNVFKVILACPVMLNDERIRQLASFKLRRRRNFVFCFQHVL